MSPPTTISRTRSHFALQALTLLAVLAIWELAAHDVHNSRLFPTIEQVALVSFPSIGQFGAAGEAGAVGAVTVLLVHTGITVGRIVVAIALGAPLGLATGIAVYLLQRKAGVSALALIAVRSIPLLALIPLFGFWLGTAWYGCILYIAFGVFVIVSSDAYEAMGNLSLVLVQHGHLLGAQRGFLIRTVYLPGIAAEMRGSLRNLVGYVWAFSLGAEYIAAQSGLGYLTYQTYLYSDMGRLSIFGLIYMLLSYGSLKMLAKLDALQPWSYAPATPGAAS